MDVIAALTDCFFDIIQIRLFVTYQIAVPHYCLTTTASEDFSSDSAEEWSELLVASTHV